MTDITLYYWISPELWQAANTFAGKKNRAAHLWGLMGSLGLLIGGGSILLGQKSSFAIPMLYLFSAVCFAAEILYLIRGFFVFGKNREEISLTVREDGILCSRTGAEGLFYPWLYLLEIRTIREKKSKNDWLAIMLSGPISSLLPFAGCLLLGSRNLKGVLPVSCAAFTDDAARQAFVDTVNTGILSKRKFAGHESRVN
jgi:hypothetical protein